eukprot:gene31550-6736_t
MKKSGPFTSRIPGLVPTTLVTSGIPALVPPALGDIITLQTIRLGGSPFMSGALPRQWSALNNLVSMEISGSEVVGSLPPSWSTLTQLESITIVNNPNLTGSLPGHWSSLMELQSLTLTGNALTGGLAPTWSNLNSLTSLDVSYNFLTSTVPAEWGQEERLQNLVSLTLDGNNLMCGVIPINIEDLKPSVKETNLRQPCPSPGSPSPPPPPPPPELTTLFLASVDRDLWGSTSQLPQLLGVAYQIDTNRMSTSFSVPASSPVTDCSLSVMGSQIQEIAHLIGVPMENISNACNSIDESKRRALHEVGTTPACMPTAAYSLNISLDPNKDQAEIERLMEDFIRTMRNPACVNPLESAADFVKSTVVRASYEESLNTSAQVLCEEWTNQAGALLSAEIATQESGGGFPMVAIIGAGVGGLLLVLIFLVLCFCRPLFCATLRKKKYKEDNSKMSTIGSNGPLPFDQSDGAKFDGNFPAPSTNT